MTRDKLGKITSVLSAELSRLLGDRLVGVYLYGSQAQGRCNTQFGYRCFGSGQRTFDYFGMVEETGQMVSDLSLENDTVIVLAYVSEEDFQNRHIPFLMNVRREAIPL